MSELITPQNGLKSDLKKSEIRDKIIEKISKFENLDKYKIDSEFIKLVCNLIEYFVKKKYSINKKDLFFDVYYKVFPTLSEDEKQSIIKIIQFVFDNGHIEKLSYYKLFTNCLTKWIEKKIL